MTVSLPELCRLRVGFPRIHEATHCYVVYVARIANRYLLMLKVALSPSETTSSLLATQKGDLMADYW